MATNTTGSNNTAAGAQALSSNTTGTWNTATGAEALEFNTTGSNNTATGGQSLSFNTTASENTAHGYGALYSNTTGSYNTASGYNALSFNTTGSSNVAVGYNAGSNLTTGSNNIDIGHEGVAGESNTIRIGTPRTQTQTFIAGIRGGVFGGTNPVAVMVDSNGQLGIGISSRRFKDDIADMGGASSGLMKLRPVTFHYKSEQNPAGRTLQNGLIAEEVAEVYPGLVAHSKDGQIETVLYQFLPPMLLNEYQKQQRTIDARAAELARQTARFEAAASALKAENETLRAKVEAGDAQIRRLTEQLAALAQAVVALGDRRQ